MLDPVLQEHDLNMDMNLMNYESKTWCPTNFMTLLTTQQSAGNEADTVEVWPRSQASIEFSRYIILRMVVQLHV